MSGEAHLHAFEAGASEPERVQRELLARTVRDLPGTAYGRALGAGDVAEAERYVRAVPLARYEDLRPWVERVRAGEPAVLTRERALAFFRTSGTASLPKLVPVTPSLLREKATALGVFWSGIHRDHPPVATGALVANFVDAGEPERTEAGVEICSESSFWSRRGRVANGPARWPLPAALRRVEDLDARLYAAARLLLQAELRCIMCLNPSTLLQFCRTVDERAPELAAGLRDGSWGTDDPAVRGPLDAEGGRAAAAHLRADPAAAERLLAARADAAPSRLGALWPALELVVCWRSEPVRPYFSQLAPHVADLPVRDYVSQSSECMMAVPLADGRSGGALAYTSHFFEFVPEAEVERAAPRTAFAWELDEGARYELVATTGGGLYRYRTGDCVRVTGFLDRVPTIEFLHRFGRTSSITGEKLTERQVLEAAREAGRASGWRPREFLCFPRTGSVPCYAVMVDGPETGPRTGGAATAAGLRWLGAFEAALSASNPEYRDKRASGRLGAMRLYLVAGGALARERAAAKPRGVSDAQVKPEVLSARLDRHADVDSATLVGDEAVPP